MQKVIIVGTGCAGLTAAIYTARANLEPLVLEGREPGGQLTSTTLVENFPGFPEGIDGPQLVMNMHRQAEKFGAEFKYAEVREFEPVNGHYRLNVDGESIDTQSVIIASGASAKWLGLEQECRFKGHGVTSCATCDGAFYRNVPVCVIGGGDTATEEAIFLTRFASEVFLIHRRDTLRATKIMAERALNHPKIKPIWKTEVSRYLPDKKGEIEGVELRNVETGKLSSLGSEMCFRGDRPHAKHRTVQRKDRDGPERLPSPEEGHPNEPSRRIRRRRRGRSGLSPGRHRRRPRMRRSDRG